MEQMHFDIGWISVFIIIGLLNLYLVYHYFRIPFKSYKPFKRSLIAVIHVTLMSIAIFYFFNFFTGRTQIPFMDILMYFAGIYLCMLFYSVGFFFIYDILRTINHFKEFPQKLRHFAHTFFYGGLTIFIISMLVTAFGLFSAHHIVIKEYSTTISQKSSSIETLNIAAISDAHAGVTVKEKEIIEIKDRIMALEPDLILIVGDIFDEGTTEELKKVVVREWSELYAPYGVYFVLGNHDDYTGLTDKQVGFFSDAGIKVLRNEAVLVDDLFYIAGRDDRNQNREPYSHIEEQISKDMPTIVMDHRPESAEVSKSDKADIQLSGHTHNGQLFPIQTFDIFDMVLNYGLHKRGKCQILVSSGVGNYGVPVRIGSSCEIVNLNLQFK